MRTIARRLTVVVAAGAIMLMSANAASATTEPPVTTTAREVLDLGNGWFSNSPVTTDVTKDVVFENFVFEPQSGDDGQTP